MTYQVLANKWRPKKFTDIVGQSNIITILQNSLDTNRLHHAYLFTGTRGVGKTTIARILAKALICERGISSNPCNNCELCQEVNKANCLDVIEIDAASKTKVEDTRLILDNLIYSSNKARFKIYIIDEIHMLSNHSFNALLKSLEEPPEHVKFILATTDPQKLPITVLSRCLQLKLKLIPINYIIKQLDKILTSENKTFEQEGLLQIATAANGSMRDALSLLEQVLAFSNKLPVINYHAVIKALNLPDEIKTINLLKAVIISDLNMVMSIIKDLFLDNCDPVNILQNIQLIIKNIILLQLCYKGQNKELNNLSSNYNNIITNKNSFEYNNLYLNEIPHKHLLLELADLSTEEDLQLYYEISVQGFKVLAFTPDIQVGFEMIILRMLAFKPLKISEDQQLNPKNLSFNNLNKAYHEKSIENQKNQSNPDIHNIKSLDNLRNQNINERNTVDFTEIDHTIDHVSTTDNTSIVNSSNNINIIDKIDIDNVNVDNKKTIFDDLSLIESLEISGLTKDLAMNGVFNLVSENIIQMIIDKEKQLMVTNKNISNLQSAFSKLLSREVKLKVSFMDFNSSPNLFMKTLKYQQQIKEQQFIDNDDNLKQLIKDFNGQIKQIEGLN